MTRPDLDAIRARCDAATPGPWKPESEQGHGRGVRAIASVAWCSVACAVGKDSQSIGQRDASRNARFIANARADVPALLAYIDMLEHMLSEERENVDTLRARVAELEAEFAALRHRDALLKRAHDALTDAGSVQPLAFDGTIEHAIKDLARRATRAEQLFVDESDAHQETRELLTDLWLKQRKADAEQMREYGISYRGLRSLLAEYDGGEFSIGKVLDLLRAAAREMAKEEVAELKARITTLEATR